MILIPLLFTYHNTDGSIGMIPLPSFKYRTHQKGMISMELLRQRSKQNIRRTTPPSPVNNCRSPWIQPPLANQNLPSPCRADRADLQTAFFVRQGNNISFTFQFLRLSFSFLFFSSRLSPLLSVWLVLPSALFRFNPVNSPTYPSICRFLHYESLPLNQFCPPEW